MNVVAIDLYAPQDINVECCTPNSLSRSVFGIERRRKRQITLDIHNFR